jgi:hypothetical protein
LGIETALGLGAISRALVLGALSTLELSKNIGLGGPELIRVFVFFVSGSIFPKVFYCSWQIHRCLASRTFISEKCPSRTMVYKMTEFFCSWHIRFLLFFGIVGYAGPILKLIVSVCHKLF